MTKIYGYCRMISTPKQNIERQVRNILKEFPSAIIIKETFSGYKSQGSRELEKIINNIQAGDTIILDSVSRMTRVCSHKKSIENHSELDYRNENYIQLIVTSKNFPESL